MKTKPPKTPDSSTVGVDNGVSSMEQGIIKAPEPSSTFEETVKPAEDIQGNGTEPIITPSENSGLIASESMVQGLDETQTIKERIFNLLKVYPDGLTDSEIRDKLDMKNNPYNYLRDLVANNFVIRKPTKKSEVGKKVTKNFFNNLRPADDETVVENAHSSSGWKTTLKTIQTLTKLDKNLILENAVNAYLQQILMHTNE